MLDEPHQTALRELTDRLRRAAVTAHASSLPERLREPLHEMLDHFVLLNPVGIAGAYWSVGVEAGLPPLPPAVLEVDDFFLFSWGSVVRGMMEKVWSKEKGPLGADITAGLTGIEDCTAVFAYEPWKVDSIDAGALSDRLDRIASAYSVGVAVAWPGVTKSAPRDIQRVRSAIGDLDPSDRAVLHERYRALKSIPAISKVRGVAEHEGPLLVAAALTRIWRPGFTTS